MMSVVTDFCPPRRRFEARVVVLDVAIPVLRGQQATIHAHTGEQWGGCCEAVAVACLSFWQPALCARA